MYYDLSPAENVAAALILNTLKSVSYDSYLRARHLRSNP